MAQRIKYIGEDRRGYAVGNPRKRVHVASGSCGTLVKRDRGSCLIQVMYGDIRVRFHCPSWQLRKLVKHASK